jgi:hypothetical protein
VDRITQPLGRNASPAEYWQRTAHWCDVVADDAEDEPTTRKFRAYAAQDRRKATRARVEARVRATAGLRWIPAAVARVHQGNSAREPRRPRTTRTVGARGDPSSRSENDPPLADLARTAAASARMVARIARRERRRFHRAGEVAA